MTITGGFPSSSATLVGWGIVGLADLQRLGASFAPCHPGRQGCPSLASMVVQISLPCHLCAGAGPRVLFDVGHPPGYLGSRGTNRYTAPNPLLAILNSSSTTLVICADGIHILLIIVVTRERAPSRRGEKKSDERAGFPTRFGAACRELFS